MSLGMSTFTRSNKPSFNPTTLTNSGSKINISITLHIISISMPHNEPDEKLNEPFINYAQMHHFGHIYNYIHNHFGSFHQLLKNKYKIL